MAGLAFCVEQAFETDARVGVTGPRVLHVNVVVALARLAPPAVLVGVTIVTWGTLVTPGTCIGRDEGGWERERER